MLATCVEREYTSGRYIPSLDNIFSVKDIFWQCSS